MLDMFGGGPKWRLGRHWRAQFVYSRWRVIACSILFQLVACFSLVLAEFSTAVQRFVFFRTFLPESAALLRFDAITLFKSRILCASGNLAGQI